MATRLITHAEQVALTDTEAELEEMAAAVYPLSPEHYLYVEMVSTAEEMKGILGNQSANLETRDADNRVDMALQRASELLARARVATGVDDEPMLMIVEEIVELSLPRVTVTEETPEPLRLAEAS